MNPPAHRPTPLVPCLNVHRCGNSVRSWSRTPLCRECIQATRLGPILRTAEGQPISIREYLRQRREAEGESDPAT